MGTFQFACGIQVLLLPQKSSAVKKNNVPFHKKANFGKIHVLYTLVFQLEEVCGINVVAHKMKNVSGGI